MSEGKLAEARIAVGEVLRKCQSSRKRAILKRNAGENLEAAKDVSWFYALLNQKENRFLDRDEKFRRFSRLFLVATLIAHDKRTIEIFGKSGQVPSGPKNLGATLDALERADDPDARQKRLAPKPDPARRESRYERRLRLLLDADLPWNGTGELPFRLRQCIAIILQKEVQIDWPQLLEDLDRWNHPNKSVQKEWATAFYAPNDNATPDDSEEEKE